MHGELILNSNNEPIYTTVPENLTVYTINSVAPGVPNISTLENYENLSEQIYAKVETIEDWNTVNAENLSEELKRLLVELNKEQSEEIIKLVQQNYSKRIKNEHHANYAYHYDKSFQIKTYYGNQNIPNKLFLKFTENEIEQIEQDDDIENGYFNKIVLYNLEGQPDLFELLEAVSGNQFDRIDISQICDFFTSLGVENLIIVDLSCSIFRGENPLSERETRYARRQFSKLYGGKKTRKYKKKRKSKKRKTKQRI